MKYVVLTSALLMSCHASSDLPEPAPDSGKQKNEVELPKDPKKIQWVGMSEAAAISLSKKLGITHRVVHRDGQDFPVTRDFRPKRLNLYIIKGVVTKIFWG